MRHHPALRASYNQWRASVESVRSADVLPNPVVQYGLFLRSIETRVGPQRHKVGIRQMLPWPGRLRAQADISTHQARAAEQRFEARALVLQRDVVDAWWSLWELRALRHIDSEHLQLLDQLAGSMSARLELGHATLSETNRLDLTRARLLDRVETSRARERKAQTQLAVLVGDPTLSKTPTSTPKLWVRSSSEDEADIIQSALQHPALRAYDHRIAAHRATLERAQTQRIPNVTLGVDWIETGLAAPQEGHSLPADSGRDALLAHVAVEVPIWLDAYAGEESKARALENAEKFSKLDFENYLSGKIRATIAMVRDTGRRIHLLHSSLIPQSKTTYLSVLGEYETGRVSLTVLLEAFRDTLELRQDLVRARSRHARAWSALESFAGRTIPSRLEILTP